jgi:hypothetical protein
MKRILLIMFFVPALYSSAQVYNNEWIDYSKTYYKFKVGATGVYRISQSSLSAIGLSSTPAEHFQLWRNGQQVPIYTSVQTGPLGPSDFIEFWGERNDGKPDNALYRNPDHQLNDKRSLQTDTASFFLTVNPGGTNLRLVPTLNDIPGNTLPADSFFMHTVGDQYAPFQKMHPGYASVVGDYVYSSNYDAGEGWTTFDIGPGITFDDLQTNIYPYTGPGAPDPYFHFNAIGFAYNPRHVLVTINGDTIVYQPMDFFDYIKVTVPVQLSTISSGTAYIRMKNAGTNAGDRMVVGKDQLIYPRQFNFGGAINFKFTLPANTNGNYLEITNFNHNGTAPVLYDLTNGRRYVADISNPLSIKIALLPSATERELVLVSQDATNLRSVTSFQQRNFINLALPANQGDFLIITHPALTVASGGSNPIEAYRLYRSSPAGGGYNARIYLIDELIDQFGLGIKMHPLSIKNFLRWARANFTAPLKNVFLIGKGLTYNQFRNNESNVNLHLLNFVPTFGWPASDNLLSTEPGDEIPVTPIGRLSVITGDEVSVYLNKVIQYEQAQAFSSPYIADKAWMKNVIHIVGSSNPTLESILLNYMANYKRIIIDTFYGANVHSFSKTSSETVQQINNSRIYELFEEGISLLTYFGHSSATTLEFNLDNPENYNNHGKYPVMIAMGCNAGNFYNFNTQRLQVKETLSERFVLANERGSIAFVASSSLGIVPYLDLLNAGAYNAMAKTKYGQSLGEVMKEAITQVFNFTGQNEFYARLHCEQATIHGDPAVKLNAFAKPDYVIEDPLVKISPAFISIAENQFNVDATILNIGKALNNDIVVEVKRTYPDNSTAVIQRDTIRGIRFIDSLRFIIPVTLSDKGLNKITVTVDPDNDIDELYETNNSVTKDIFIYEDEARPVYPYNFAIINTQNIKLAASTANAFAPSKQYRMELDTTELFNSPFKKTQHVTSTGGLLEFTPGFTFTDSTVYYWRVSPVPASGPFNWNTSSFIYLANSDPGFNQSHYFQHDKSGMNRIVLNAQDRIWKYDSVDNNIFAKNGVFGTATNQEGDLVVSVNGDPYIRSACVGYSLIFNIFNPCTIKPNQNLNQAFGSGPVCAPSRQWNYEFSYMNSIARKNMMDFMEWIPDNYYVVVRTINNAGQGPGGFVADWQNDTTLYGSGNSLYHKLKAAGFNDVDSFYRIRSMIFMYQKNSSHFIPKSSVSQGLFDIITLNQDLKGCDTLGTVTSPLFGPAKAWKDLKWRGSSAEPVSTDSIFINVIGVQNNGAEVVLFNQISPTTQDLDISSIDASVYPYVKLHMVTHDTANFTPYQLRYWRLTYVPVPEGAIAPNIFLSTKDVIETGEPLDFKAAFKNISSVAFDSMKVKMIITDRNNVPNIIPIPRRRPLPANGNPNDTLHVGSIINTANFTGTNSIFLEVNPDNDQPEQYHFNNFLYRDFYVKPDSLSPLLDVTFDGVHILNRDIVSAKPDIVVKLKDESRWMILDDTSLLRLQVRYPNGTLRRFFFANDTLQFIPAGQAPNPDNTATVNFRPYFTEDGEYELIVSGKDKSDNAAGNIEYKVSFQVINKPMISNMLNYPNPFTTSTAFVFTITGSEVPQNIKIEIMTITGKIVREITKDELGPLHIGRNITEFKWDGTDQYGQKLANGIYLYRVVTNLNGKTLDKYKASGDNTDKYFNKGYGKMYLMR